MRYTPYLRPSSLAHAVLSQIYHPNVVLFMGACTQPGKIQIVTERMSTDLDKFLRSPKGRAMPLFVRLKMAKDAAKGTFFFRFYSFI